MDGKPVQSFSVGVQQHINQPGNSRQIHFVSEQEVDGYKI